mmetsp:Transcript_5735/g.4928  ORF Transcript_5735/g.4928 Transcript_5735/m.4928 type:complete len:129 (+) Transcript_5735:344-730(+)
MKNQIVIKHQTSDYASYTSTPLTKGIFTKKVNYSTPNGKVKLRKNLKNQIRSKIKLVRKTNYKNQDKKMFYRPNDYNDQIVDINKRHFSMYNKNLWNPNSQLLIKGKSLVSSKNSLQTSKNLIFQDKN